MFDKGGISLRRMFNDFLVKSILMEAIVLVLLAANGDAAGIGRDFLRDNLREAKKHASGIIFHTFLSMFFVRAIL